MQLFFLHNTLDNTPLTQPLPALRIAFTTPDQSQLHNVPPPHYPSHTPPISPLTYRDTHSSSPSKSCTALFPFLAAVSILFLLLRQLLGNDDLTREFHARVRSRKSFEPVGVRCVLSIKTSVRGSGVHPAFH